MNKANMKGRIFKSVQTNHPGRSAFDLSYSKLLTCDMGQLIPVMCDEVVPGDKFKIGNEIVIRFQPLVAPVLHEINAFVHYFFVPNRIMWDGWEDFISGGVDGMDSSTLPRWTIPDATHSALGGLWDYLGFTLDVTPDGAMPLDFPRIAYNMIYNQYYLDETLQTEVALDNENILIRSWEKDYFTSSLPWQQRGTAPSLPISGLTSAVFPSDVEGTVYKVGETPPFNVNTDSGGMLGTTYVSSPLSLLKNVDLATDLNNNVVDLSNATTFDVADLRLAFQIQKWMERNARCGVRYTEFLRAHFGVSPRDDRLQRPEYIGGSKAPIIISEVLQTSQTDTSPQGTMAGHAISASTQFCGSYFAQEYGWIVGIMSIMPKPMYQQGINRQFLRRTKYDYYFPEFANLSEQAIEMAEINTQNLANINTSLFGYQGRYDEMRYKPNMVCGLMRSGQSGSLDFWNLARWFPGSVALNEDFIKCVPDKRIFAVENQPGLIVSFGNLIKAIRPLPISGMPGLIDHN